MTTLWRHKKRGTVYEVVTDHAMIQCATEPYIEEVFGGDKWTIYRDVQSGSMWIRLTKEFLDGRFEKVER